MGVGTTPEVSTERSQGTCPVLALFNHTRETIVFADASSYGLGAVLLQRQQDGELKPISYISRSLTPTEQRYAQIEKETLSRGHANDSQISCSEWSSISIQITSRWCHCLFQDSRRTTDTSTAILMRYRFTISPRASLKVADALSRAPYSEAQPADVIFERETAAYVDAVVQSLPATDKQIERIKHRQEEDEECQEAIRYTQSGWPSRQELYGVMKHYLNVATELSVKDGILMRGSRIVIPVVLRPEMLDRVHTGQLEEHE